MKIALATPGSSFNRAARLPAKTAQSKSNGSEQRIWAPILEAMLTVLHRGIGFQKLLIGR